MPAQLKMLVWRAKIDDIWYLNVSNISNIP